jgi:hypothetical protein
MNTKSLDIEILEDFGKYLWLQKYCLIVVVITILTTGFSKMNGHSSNLVNLSVRAEGAEITHSM